MCLFVIRLRGMTKVLDTEFSNDTIPPVTFDYFEKMDFFTI